MKQSDFDKYEDSYVETVERSIQFSGLKHDFFQQAKQKMLRQVIYKHFRGNEKLSLLDVGCGVGSLHPYIKELVHSIVGVDISHQSIKRAKLNNSDNRYFSYDGERLPFEANKFNIVMAVCVMHHVHPDKWSFFLSEMSRVTQENGLVVVIEHNPLNPLTKFAVSRCPFDVDATLLSARRVSKLMKYNNLNHLDSKYFIFSPSNKSFVNQVEKRLAWLPFGGQYIAVGIK